MKQHRPYADSCRLIVQYIDEYTLWNGCPPSLREISSHLGWSTVGNTSMIIARIRGDGYLTIPAAGTRARGLVVTPQGRALIGAGARMARHAAQLAREADNDGLTAVGDMLRRAAAAAELSGQVTSALERSA